MTIGGPPFLYYPSWKSTLHVAELGWVVDLIQPLDLCTEHTYLSINPPHLIIHKLVCSCGPFFPSLLNLFHPLILPSP